MSRNSAPLEGVGAPGDNENEVTPEMIEAATRIIDLWISENWSDLKESVTGDVGTLLERLAPLYSARGSVKS
jgi:hypothetical protein